MKTLYFTDDDAHKRSLAWVRKMVLLSGDVEGEELLELLETDRPRWGNVTPIASRRAPGVERAARVERIAELERNGLEWAIDRMRRGIL